jgi:hypothetical protein
MKTSYMVDRNQTHRIGLYAKIQLCLNHELANKLNYSEGIDSDVEDAMMSRLYYTSNSNVKEAKKESGHGAVNDSKLTEPLAQTGKKRSYSQLSSSSSDEGENHSDYDDSGSIASDLNHPYDDSRQASCEDESDMESDDSDDNSIAFTPGTEDVIPVTKIIDLEKPVEAQINDQDAEEYSFMDNAAFQVCWRQYIFQFTVFANIHPSLTITGSKSLLSK